MPYHINTVGPGKFEVVDDQGKVAGTHPTRKQALAQLKALYANVPEAKEESDIDVSEKGDAPGHPFRGNQYSEGQSVRVTGSVGGEFSGDSPAKIINPHSNVHKVTNVDKRGREYEGAHSHIPTATVEIDRSKRGLKPLRFEAYHHQIKREDKEAEDMDATDKATAEINNLPDSAFLYVESGGDKDEGGRTVPRSLRHLPYKTQDGGIDLPKLRNALSRLGQSATGTTGGERWLTEGVRKSLISKAQKILADNTDAESAKPESKEAQDAPSTYQKQSILDRVIISLTGWKEGRRNSTPDGDRLQQIHDLAVLNGASCPMVMKEASGKLRWVLLSSNAFIDSDKEIISTKALEDDVARTDKQAQAQKIGEVTFGPLRWWHMGAPDPIALNAGSGADIGDCDYRAMSGRVLIESGTFRNERIGEAIKEHANTLAGSIGFFHPKDEPDSEGVYRNIVQFERSLLPRGKASNMLTALTVKGWEDMATSKEKQDALAALLGDPQMAEAVIKQAEQTEKAADDRGLKYKEQEATEKALTGTPTAVPATGASGINPIGLEKDGKKAKKAEGEPGEESSESAAESASEPDWEKMMKGLAPYIGKMIEEKMRAGAKESAEKEAGVKAQLDQIAADVQELKGDVPHGLQSGFRASISDATILKDINFKNAPTGDNLDSVVDQLMGVKK